MQESITKSDLVRLQKAYKHAAGVVTGSTKTVVIGAVGTTAAIAATGGLAFFYCVSALCIV